MGQKIGHIKFGGRKKDTPNRQTGAVIAILARHKHCPITAMVLAAKNPTTPLELRCKLNIELAQFVYPKRKAIEHSGVEGGPLVVELVRYADTDPQ